VHTCKTIEAARFRILAYASFIAAHTSKLAGRTFSFRSADPLAAVGRAAALSPAASIYP